MNTPRRTPLTAQQFRDKWQISRTKYHELVNSGKLRQTYVTPKLTRITPEDEDAFIASCQTSKAKDAA